MGQNLYGLLPGVKRYRPMKQQTLAIMADQKPGYEHYRNPARLDEFLQTIQPIMQLAELCAGGEPHFAKASNGRPPTGLECMLRIHFIH